MRNGCTMTLPALEIVTNSYIIYHKRMRGPMSASRVLTPLGLTTSMMFFFQEVPRSNQQVRQSTVEIRLQQTDNLLDPDSKPAQITVGHFQSQTIAGTKSKSQEIHWGEGSNPEPEYTYLVLIIISATTASTLTLVWLFTPWAPDLISCHVLSVHSHYCLRSRFFCIKSENEWRLKTLQVFWRKSHSWIIITAYFHAWKQSKGWHADRSVFFSAGHQCTNCIVHIGAFTWQRQSLSRRTIGPPSPVQTGP